MSDDLEERYLQILSWRPPRDPKLLDDGPLFVAMHDRIASLGLDPRIAARLLLAGWALSDLQRHSRVFERHRGGPLPQREFGDVAKAASKFLERLQMMDKEIEMLVAVDLHEHGGSLSRLHDALERFRDVTQQAARETKRQRGGQQHYGTLRTFTLLMKRYEDATGDEVGRSSMRNSDSDPHLSGLGGRFITEWFELVDPRVTASALFRLWPKARKRLDERGRVIVSDDETLKRIELSILNRQLSSQ